MVVFDGHEYLTEEEKRLKEDRDRVKYWKKWGPYVAERQWATGGRPCLPTRISIMLTSPQSVRTTVPTAMPGVVSPRNPSPPTASPSPSRPGAVSVPILSDTALADFSHDHARSRAFRWGEDGIAGVSDTHGLQNIAFSFWNEEECVAPASPRLGCIAHM